MNIAQADKLSDAICESDVEKVSLAIAERKPTAKQLTQYLDIAEQTMKIRQDILVAGRWAPKIKDRFKACIVWTALSYFGLVISTEAFQEYVTRNTPDELVKARARLTVLAFFASTIASSIALLTRFESEDLEKKYANAVAIKGMLYDLLDLETIDSANKIAALSR